MSIIKVTNLNKVYKLYDEPIHRLKEAFSISKKSYSKEYYALNDVSFEIEKGEILGIVGNNGSGKSTLLKIITGVLNPTSGMVEINGKVSALLELGAGFNGEYTGLENIFLYGTMMGKSKEETTNEVQGILDFADIGEFIHQPVKTYSSGMFARLAFSVAINVQPDILIVDEILSVGDQNFQIKCMKKMKEMMSGGTTVLYVAHDVNSIKRFCTKVLWLKQGVVQDYGDVDLVTDKYLDFLKGKLEEQEETEQPKNQKDELEPFSMLEGQIAEIKSFTITNSRGEAISEVSQDEPLQIDITYDVYDDTLEKVVLGVALRSIDEDYVCGLNTLLDGYQIPWKFGRNKMTLKYTSGILAIGGEYYFDVALMEETATVPIQYLAKEKVIRVLNKYIGEGRYIIPHYWKGD
ncbi:MAG: teichoic acid ABC transporter ATP-binding protein [Epulopiscium sp. Nele67-Bin004]|nr:MAG: teichoic acid ABC transporter ATP-binding protein [Epulopiscium sp. Nele67-Bin004]